MILDGFYDLKNLYGLQVKNVDGIYDWPKLKNAGTDWPDSDYIDILNRFQDFQYESRLITVDCVLIGVSWSDLGSKLTRIRTLLVSGVGLKMLVLPGWSVRGFMVRLNKSTLMRPRTYFQDGKTAASFSLVFEEPQPFNFQFSFLYETAGLNDISFTISKLSSTHSYKSDEQKFITVNYGYVSDAWNLEEGAYELVGSMNLGANIPYPIIITGNIDSIEDLSISANGVVGLDVADFFLRNGSVSLI